MGAARWAAALLGDTATVAEADADLVGLPGEHDTYVEAGAAWVSVLQGERSDAQARAGQSFSELTSHVTPSGFEG